MWRDRALNKKKWTIWLSATLLVVMAVSGYFAIAAEYGSKEDPLVTLSYIEDVLSPATMNTIQQAFDTQKQDFEAQINTKIQTATADMDRIVAEYKNGLAAGTVSQEAIDAIADQVLAKMQADGPSPGATASVENNWAVVKVDAGKKLMGGVGCAIILRIGTATCTAPGSPGLINLTGGNELGSGGALVANQLYIITVANERGIVAGSAGCTVLVNGSYTIS